jgi:riboflavin synthase
MFTGIIEELGFIVEITRSTEVNGGARMVIRAEKALSGPSPLQEGESIAVSGVCLTAREIRGATFLADLSPETLERTNLGTLSTNSRVNLERAMTPASRFGGHIVQGHVDGVGRLVALDPLPDGNYWLSVEVAPELTRYLVEKGSITLNGISLTIARLDGCRVGVAIIPHTYTNTTLSDLLPGDALNVECDVLAKHVEKLLSAIFPQPGGRGAPAKPSSLTLQRLIDEGF